MSGNKFLLGGLLIAALLGGLWLASQQQKGTQLRYLQEYPQPRALPEFSLRNQHDRAFGNADLLGHWTLTFVGYTYCPDICPTTLAELNGIYPQLQQLPADSPLQVLFISVDPKRDSVARLNEYVTYFNQDFIAATAGHDVLFPLVRAMGMMYGISESTENDDYLVDHSASIVVINPQGQVIGRFKPDNQPGKVAIASGQQILADMPVLLAR